MRLVLALCCAAHAFVGPHRSAPPRLQATAQEISAKTEGTETIFSLEEVQKILPHRYPFILLDWVIEIDGYKKAVAVKNVTINEPFFQGHFPDAPLMPGVLQLESMAQLAGVLLLRKLENTGKLAVLWAIDKVKLRGSVTPGDQLRIEVETEKMKGKIARVNGSGYVAGKLVCEAQLTFTMVDA